MNFKDDYSIGAHPRVIEALAKANSGLENSYQHDTYSVKAAGKIKEIIGNEKALVRFVAGGTLANLLVIAASLKAFEAVISVESGHINLHETGAVEYTGHKIIPVKGKNGKILPGEIEKVLEEHQTPPHMVKPKMVYISQSTEYGTIYSKEELREISRVCKENNLLLFMDGARLGAALTSPANDLKIEEIAQYTDAFYIGGTKNGGLMGEAIVINRPGIQKDFDYHLKQKGALVAKTRFFGAQFLALFEDDLYFELAHKANTSAEKLGRILTGKGVKLKYPVQTNQLFPVLPDKLVEKLQKKAGFYVWEKPDEKNSVIRLVTSWQTTPEEIEDFSRLLS